MDWGHLHLMAYCGYCLREKENYETQSYRGPSKKKTSIMFAGYQDDEQNGGMRAHPTGYLQKGSGGSQIKGNMFEPLAISEGRIWLTRTQITEADYWSLLGQEGPYLP